ncbi:MAG: Permease [Candidatus Daviesbacteria bacterium GW2011_GWB1_36_5]|uniref:Permease n=1 Tax=Candidatus Daviesbacteria bacterium GW2011_GWB1_36_5 TaxID=1618426 RepID=A0A0G0EM10_9BACT|nr:MAG: Permease [Candidatus Daviesbacteria bacterium GW2011_GWB1_36_5]
MRAKISAALPAFKHLNYRYYFGGQLVSLIGTWVQTVAQGWLVWELTHSAFMVGAVSALGFLPITFFALFGGVLIDRLHTRHVLIFTQTASMILALLLGVLVILGLANIWVVAIFAFLLGTINSLDMPARQAFTIEMVGREHLPSAIALNMGTFNTARIIGPAIAGVLIALFGTGWAFILNGVSFIAPLGALFFMKIESDIPNEHPHPIEAIKNGLKYAYTHPLIKNLLIFSSATSIFGFSYTTIMPYIADVVFHQNATGLGYLYAAGGAGAIVGTLFISAFHKKFKTSHIILGGCLLFTISLFLFTLTKDLYLALPMMFLSGIGISAQIAMVNSTIHSCQLVPLLTVK